MDEWRMSSFTTNGSCVEVCMDWHKSNHSGVNGCAEVSIAMDKVFIRDHARPDETAWFTEESWEAFIAGVKNGEFDLKKVDA